MSVSRASSFPIAPPVEPMLSAPAESVPAGEGWLYEPKWDGFRAIIFRSAADVFIQSRDLRPLDRYFPELHEAFLAQLPPACVLDGEIVIVTEHGLDFEALQLRLHPAASRVATLVKTTPAAFVAFDLLAVDGRDVRATPQAERRALLERLLRRAARPLYLTPITCDRKTALVWLREFEGAGLDGVIAKPADGTYQPGKRSMTKVKHVRTADCVVAGFRRHKSGADAVGSLLLGLYDEQRTLHHVGVTSAFPMATRRQLANELAPLRHGALDNHPWRDWANPDAGRPARRPAAGQHETQAAGNHVIKAGEFVRMPGGHSRWSAGKDLSWEPLRIERVCEVKYDHLQGRRFRHAAVFLRWRPDKRPADCRYDQLETTAPFELERVFGEGRR